jgi:hypothetical protein
MSHLELLDKKLKRLARGSNISEGVDTRAIFDLEKHMARLKKQTLYKWMEGLSR